MQGSVAEVERLSTLVVELRDGRRRLGTGGFLDDESMNLKDFFNKNTYMFFNYFMFFFFLKSSHIIGFMKVKHTVVFFLMEETPRQASGCGQDHGMVPSIEAEAVHHLWTCDGLTCQGL